MTHNETIYFAEKIAKLPLYIRKDIVEENIEYLCPTALAWFDLDKPPTWLDNKLEGISKRMRTKWVRFWYASGW